jgi:hypothetical protein
MKNVGLVMVVVGIIFVLISWICDGFYAFHIEEIAYNTGRIIGELGVLVILVRDCLRAEGKES